MSISTSSTYPNNSFTPFQSNPTVGHDQQALNTSASTLNQTGTENENPVNYPDKKVSGERGVNTSLAALMLNRALNATSSDAPSKVIDSNTAKEYVRPPATEKPLEDGAGSVLDDLDQQNRQLEGDKVLAKSTLSAMLNERETVVMEGNSSIAPWKRHIDNLFDNPMINNWCRQSGIEPSSLYYDTTTQTLHGKGTNGVAVSFGKDDPVSHIPLYRDLLLPFAEAAKVVAPNGGVNLRKTSSDTVALDLVKSFYGVDVPGPGSPDFEAKLRAFSDRGEFEELPDSLFRSQEELDIQRQALEIYNRPPNRPADVEHYANELHDDLDNYAKKAQAEIDLCTSVADAMLNMTEETLGQKSPIIDIPEHATIRPWSNLVNRAMTNEILDDWLTLNKISPDDCSFDTSTQKLHVTLNGEEVSYTKEEFEEKFPRFKHALDPVIDVAKVVAPEGGIRLRASTADKAPLDLVLS